MGKMVDESEELFEQVFPTAEALMAHVGKVIAYDEQGIVRMSADSWREAMEKTDESGDLTLMYVPLGAMIGAAGLLPR